MKFVTCIGATSGMNLMTISPLFVFMCARYVCFGSNFTPVNIGTFVRHAGSFLFTAAFAICASIALIAASEFVAAAGAIFSTGFAASADVLDGGVDVAG